MEMAISRSAKEMHKKLNTLNFNSKSVPESALPCASLRRAVTTCYRVNGKDNPLACAGEVEAFAECAKQLTRIKN